MTTVNSVVSTSKSESSVSVAEDRVPLAALVRNVMASIKAVKSAFVRATGDVATRALGLPDPADHEETSVDSFCIDAQDALTALAAETNRISKADCAALGITWGPDLTGSALAVVFAAELPGCAPSLRASAKLIRAKIKAD